MAGKVKSFSTLVENQLPEFISSEYPNFVGFVKKYYEQLETPGQPLDLINNLMKYQDIDTYEKKLLKESSVLVSLVETSEVVITVENGDSFPEKNGYVMIGEEVIFYQNRIGNTFRNCYRNVSATTKLGDLYDASEYKTVPYAEVGVSTSVYSVGSIVTNISNLFLYAFVKNFENQYLASFPEENLKPTVDKKTLIKNIKYFYQAKGTDQSIKFIFNSIVSQDTDDVPTVYYPKDYTFKASNGEWVNKYSLKVKVLSGNVSNILGQRIVQSADDNDPYAIKSFAVVDNVTDLGNNFYEIVLADETIVGEFKVAAETQLTKEVTLLDIQDSVIDVFSTVGWDSSSGKLLINNEQISYKSKNVNQFVIDSRGTTPQAYPIGNKVYNYTAVESQYEDITGTTQTVRLIVLGVLYDLSIDNTSPYSIVNDRILETKTGFETRDPIVYDTLTGNTRWIINQTLSNPASVSIPSVYTGKISQLNSDVSAIYEDDQYFYITSSGFPSHDFGKSSWNKNLDDQKFLKIIKKTSSLSTEVTTTSTRDVGIAVNGIPFYGNKDYAEIDGVNNDVIFGGITEIELISKGRGYLDTPYVLIEEKLGVETAKATAFLTGEVVDRIIVDDGGTGYFPPAPTVTITSGRNGTAEAVVTLGKVTSLKLTNAGEYYSTPPEVEITDNEGKGRFAKYSTTISNDGKITGFIKEKEGKFYTQENINVRIISIGEGATAVASVRRWKKNRFYFLKNQLDDSNGYFFKNINPALGYGYAYLANPKQLRISVGDNLLLNGSTVSVLQHSKILGYAYDGNPIYGPHGYTNPLDNDSNIVRMVSSYELKFNRISGPPTATYPLGAFVEDYRYNHRLGTLDENNGRFCVTPEYPQGVYAYFITVDTSDNPVFPYIIGNTFYSIPVDSNYGKQISQDDLPKIVSRLRTDNIPDNGKEAYSYINEVNSGSVSSVDVYNSHDNFSVSNLVEVDNSNTEGSGIVARVSSVKGIAVTSIENRQTKAIQIRIENTAYLFENDIIYQENTNANGQIIGDVFDGNNIVLRNTSGSFNSTDKLYSSTKVNNLIVNKSSNFTTDSVLRLSNGKQTIIKEVFNNILNVSSNPFVDGETIVFSNTFSGITANTLYYVRNRTISSFQISPTQTGSIVSLTNNTTPTSIAESEKARGIILETTENKNNIKVKLVQGEFVVDGNYFLISSTRTDTVGVAISQVNKLSENIKIFKLNDNIAIASTNLSHNLAEGDSVNIDISPDSTTDTTYYVRKRIYQKVILKQPVFETTLFDTGIGRLRFLNSGADYASNGSQTFTNVEIIFSDQTKCRDIEGRIVGSSNSAAALGNIGGISNAKATVTVTSGLVSNVLITNKGIGYKKGDVVTFANTSLQRSNSSISTQFFIADVDHVGFSFSETILKLNKVDGLSENDLIKIGKEVLKVNTINSNSRTVSVSRAQQLTSAIDHYNTQPVTLYQSKYNLSVGYAVGNILGSGVVSNYDQKAQILTLVYDLSSSLETIDKVNLNTTFFDQSSPKKVISIDKITEEANYQFEFSLQNTLSANWVRNPIIDIQRYYLYKFDTSSQTLSGSFLEFSPSGNYNILTLETQKSNFKPGTTGSFTQVKFGFGPFYSPDDFDVSGDLIVDGDLIVGSSTITEKKSIKYTNYFYFDKNNIIQSDKSYLKIIEDPLQGAKNITYVTPRKFVYELNKIAPYDGTGIISYTTTSTSAVGKINTISISNPGKEFKQIPIVIGVRPSASLECNAIANWNSTTKTIDSVSIINAGKNYSKPKAILIGSDGSLAEFSVIKNNDGSIKAILTTNIGKNYSYLPEIKIVETDLNAYFSSNTIGSPKTIKIVNNGYNFNRDQSISKKYSSAQILILKNFIPEAFYDGEEVVQYDNNVLIAKGVISKGGWRKGSNILRLQSVEGIFKLDLPISGRSQNNTANIVKVFSNIFTPNIKSYYDNLGYYISDRSNIGSESQRIADSYFYQDYSYTIKSKTPTDVWRNLIKKTTHPAGFKVFGEVEINTKASAEFVRNPVKSGTVSFVQLWDPQKNRVTVETTRRIITTSTVQVKDANEVRGKGSAYVAPFDTAETISYEFYLDPSFDGYIDNKGNRAGTKIFNMKIKGSNSLLPVSNVNNLIISLDGIIQEPKKAYNINDSTITFSEAPFGPRFSQGSFGNDSLTAKNTVSSYQIKFKSLTGQLDLSYFVVGQEFTTSTSTRQLILPSFGGSNPAAGNYKIVDKGIGSDGNNYITAEPTGKLLPVLSPSYTNNQLLGVQSVTSSITVDGYIVNTNAYFVDYNLRSYITGVDTPPQDLIGRMIKFKDLTLNTQNFKKIKDISSQFDNIKTSFQLLYDDDTSVQLPSEDNLIVAIDGVLQRSGTTPLLPKDRAYYIRRTTIPNEIVFVEPPRKFEEVSENITTNKSKQSFFAYNVGAYERLVLDEQYIDGEFSGPFTLRSAITGKTIAVDEDRNLLVFVEEVLQKRLRSYVIRGSNISFVEPLRVGQKINIMYLYGRNSTRFITMFDFDHNDYLNRIEIKLNFNPGLKQYTDIVCYQGNSYTTNTAIGTIKKFSPVGTSTILTLDTQNKLFVANKDIYCINGRGDGLGDLIIPSSSIISIGQPSSGVYFEETEDTLDILKKTTTGWLIGSSLLPNYYNALDPEDKIKIDGEDEYRNILSIPTEVFKTEYRETADVTTGYLGKISTTNYNGIQLGEGLDIIANVDTNPSSPTYGKVTSLTWNNKDYIRYETKGILPRPAGYSYENAPRLNFVPQALKDEGGSIISQASGGGAIGYVVVHNGEPIDVVLVDGGSGYVSSPKVYITRGYYVKRSNKNSHHRIITSFFSPLVLVNDLKILSDKIISGNTPPIIIVEKFVPVTIANSNIVITAIIQIEVKPKIPPDQNKIVIEVHIRPGVLQVTSLSALASVVSTSLETTITKVETDSKVTIINSNRETLLDVRSFLKLIQTPVYPSLHETGAYLQSSLSRTDTIVYIADTSKFTVSGRLMIDNEILRYSTKLTDRFFNITRGVDGTSATTHEAGTFLRQYRENVTIVSVGAEGAGTTSDIISIGKILSGSASVSNITSEIQRVATPKVVSVGDEILSVCQYQIYQNSVISVQYDNFISYATRSTLNVLVSSASVSNITSQIQTTATPKVVSVGDEILNIVENKININSIINVSNISITPLRVDTYINLISIKSTTPNITSIINTTIQPKIVNTIFEVLRFYEFGMIDFYVENLVLDGFVALRSGTILTLDPTITLIALRDGSTINVENAAQIVNSDLSEYNIGNIGNNIQTLNSWKFMDTGTISNSGMNLQEFELSYGSLTILDLENTNPTAYIQSGVYWNAGYPSISESGALLNNNMTTTSTTLTVQGSANPLLKFPASGYIRIDNEVISYTGKTSTSLTGLTRSINGVIQAHSIGSYLITTI